jgi:uncharacterized membrane protein
MVSTGDQRVLVAEDRMATVAPASVRPADARAPATARQRLDSIDLVRGAVMVLMLLDHTRDFVNTGGFFMDPTNPDTSTPILYLTRWVTHLCAPTFVLLAGVGIGLRQLRGAPVADLSRFCLTRGLWLMAMELFVIRPLSWFNLDIAFLAHLQVIWSIGVSMVVMSALVYLPVRASIIIGGIIVLGHNALDVVRVPVWAGPESPVPSIAGKLWMMLHQGGFFPIGGFPSPIVWAHYPVVPWIGIMAVGYGLSQVYGWPADQRRRFLTRSAVVMAIAFVAIRATNLYGDPSPWAPRPETVRTVMSFFSVSKYPPSLLYALATLVPAVLALGLLDGRRFSRGIPGALVTFGRVPFFFYVLQWPTAHGAGIIVSAVQGKDTSLYFMNVLQLFQLRSIPDYGGPLWLVYVCWILGVFLLYWPCRWFAGVKARRKEWWLSYL